jgi:hypothetical protein
MKEVPSHTIRGDALLASVKRGGGSYRGPWYNVYRLAAGAMISEAVLRSVVVVESGRLLPGPASAEGALEKLAVNVRREAKPASGKSWLERTPGDYPPVSASRQGTEPSRPGDSVARNGPATACVR